MALPNLTNTNIQDTYQRLIQKGANGQLYDGTGSAVPIKIEGDNVRISGSLIAQQYVVSSSVTNVTFQQQSGSTIFGDSQDDTHQITGSLNITGSLTAISMSGDGSTLTNISSTNVVGLNLSRIASGSTTASISPNNGFLVNTNITASGVISASGNTFGNIVDGQTFSIKGDGVIERNTNDIVFAGHSNFTKIQIGKEGQLKPLQLEGNVTASGNISASGEMIATGFTTPLTGTGSFGRVSASGTGSFGALHIDRGCFSMNNGNKYVFNASSGTGEISFNLSSNNASITSKADIKLNPDSGIIHLEGATTSSNISASGYISASYIHAGNRVEATDEVVVMSPASAIDTKLTNNYIHIGGSTDNAYGEVFFHTGTSGVLTLCPHSQSFSRTRGSHTTIIGSSAGDPDTIPSFQGEKLKFWELRAGGNYPRQATNWLFSVDIRGNVSCSNSLFSPNITASGHISGSTIEGQSLIADVSFTSPLITATTITASGNITGSTIEGQILTADVFLSSPSASITNLTNTNITSSGNISASAISTIQAGSGSYHILQGDTSQATGLEVSGFISANTYLSATTITASDHITSSIIEGQTITADVFLSSPSASITNLMNTNITSSGNISSSGNFIGQDIQLFGNSFTMTHATTPTIRLQDTTNNYFVDLKMANSFGIELDGNTNQNFYIATNKYNGTNANDTALFMDGGDGRLSLNDQAVSIDVQGNISSSGNITGSVIEGQELISNGNITGTPQLQYNTSSISSTGKVQGDIIKFGDITTIAGAIYAHTGSGWSLAHSGSNGAASSSLALAVGTNSTTHGMLLRGMANIGYDPGGLNGCALYLEAPGSASNNVTTTAGHIARVIGWNYGSDTIYFNPDNTWVVSA